MSYHKLEIAVVEGASPSFLCIHWRVKCLPGGIRSKQLTLCGILSEASLPHTAWSLLRVRLQKCWHTTHPLTSTLNELQCADSQQSLLASYQTHLRGSCYYTSAAISLFHRLLPTCLWHEGILSIQRKLYRQRWPVYGIACQEVLTSTGL
jgi:hypothetical protein